jgi:UDP-GlcNAc:undecaprenyl-phosphate GlcNAc-1-phosphate transferase
MPFAVRIVLVTALAAVVLVGAFACWLGPRGWMDHPEGRKQHAHPTARVGGLAFLVVLVAAKLLGGLQLNLSPLEWGAVLGMGLVGAADDRYDLRARWKALAGMLVAVVLASLHTWQLLQSGLDVTLFGIDLPEHGVVFFPLLLMWYWGVPQAFNLIDGVNGLSLGFSCLLLGALSLTPTTRLGVGAAPLWGALLGLLVLNYPKARHFMGDSGALALGTLFAILVMNQALPVHRGLALWLMAYPVLDVTTVVAIRWSTGRPLAQADRSHLHHWLLDRLGGRAWLVTPLLLLVAALPMLRDMAWTYAKPVSAAGFLLLAGLAVVVFLDRIRRRPEAVEQPIERLQRPFVAEPSGPNRVA